MRVKQILILALLLSANIFLLAHSVLPHSHHDGIVCFSLNELKHQQTCSDHHDDTGECCCCGRHSQQEHHHSNSEDCDLKEIVIRNNDDIHNDLIPCGHCLSLLFSIYSLNEFFMEMPQFGLIQEQKPYLNSYISPYVGSVKNLRAPPLSYFFS